MPIKNICPFHWINQRQNTNFSVSDLMKSGRGLKHPVWKAVENNPEKFKFDYIFSVSN